MGAFITFEGNDKSGKSTILERTCDILEKEFPVFRTSEPGSKKSDECQQIRQLLLNPDYVICDLAEIFLFLADRSQHIESVVRPAIESGVNVISDRHKLSTLAYQGYGKYFGNSDILRFLQELNEFAVNGIEPDLTFVVLAHPDLASERIKYRSLEFGREDRIESKGIDLQKLVYHGFENIIANDTTGKIIRIDSADGNVDECVEKVVKECRRVIQFSVDGDGDGSA